MMLPTTTTRKSRIRSSNNQNPPKGCRQTRPEDHSSPSRNKSTLAFVPSSTSHATLIIPTKVDIATFLQRRMGFFPRVKRRWRFRRTQFPLGRRPGGVISDVCHNRGPVWRPRSRGMSVEIGGIRHGIVVVLLLVMVVLLFVAIVEGGVGVGVGGLSVVHGRKLNGTSDDFHGGEVVGGVEVRFAGDAVGWCDGSGGSGGDGHGGDGEGDDEGVSGYDHDWMVGVSYVGVGWLVDGILSVMEERELGEITIRIFCGVVKKLRSGDRRQGYFNFIILIYKKYL